MLFGNCFFLFFLKRFVLDSMGCNQEGGWGGDVRYSTPQKQGARGGGEETGVVKEGMGGEGCVWEEERGTGGRGRGGRDQTRPLIYLFSPLLFQALEKKAKEECKKGRERLSRVN